METTRGRFEVRETFLLVKKSFAFHKSRKGRGGKGRGVVKMLQLFWPMFEAPEKKQTLENIYTLSSSNINMMPWG